MYMTKIHTFIKARQKLNRMDCKKTYGNKKSRLKKIHIQVYNNTYTKQSISIYLYKVKYRASYVALSKISILPFLFS